MGVPFLVTVEKTEHEYVASCDELRAVASGGTEDEAVANLKLAIRALIAQYGREFAGQDPEVRGDQPRGVLGVVSRVLSPLR